MSEVLPNSEVERIYVSIVHYNSLTAHNPTILRKSFESILKQEDYILGKNLFLRICDNGSTDSTTSFLRELVAGRDIFLQINNANLGFSGAHNQSVFKFLHSNCNYLLILNPDLALEPNAIKELVLALKANPQAGLAGAKLYRGDDQLVPLSPSTLDSAGMELTDNLRHLDRGSDQLDQGQFNRPEFVFGITGACLLISKIAVQKLILPSNNFQSSLYQIYPQLEVGVQERYELFDESFFAYREDADLCWRASNQGIKSFYQPTAEGVHCRVVLPNNRKNVSSTLNYLSVRNRFLLQINNYFFKKKPRAFISGILLRNLLVFFASLTVERSSWKAFQDLRIIFKRAYQNRKVLSARVKNE